MDAAEVPVIEGLFRSDGDGVRLLGSRCGACATPYFPRAERCHHPDCGATDAMADAAFGPTGVLWSYSVQNYPPPPPARYDEPYQPYALGVVDLDDGLRVVGRMATDDPASLAVGDFVELVLGTLYHEEDGTAPVSWMFQSQRLVP